ncbi:WD repeat-containing protein 75 [Hordeum vulgare]|nr:WD repeat-containing protein 75 [Hordeum vulgare]
MAARSHPASPSAWCSGGSPPRLQHQEKKGSSRTAKLASHYWTAGLDVFLIYWDFATAELVRKVKVDAPVHSMVIPNISKTLKVTEVYTAFAFVSVEALSKTAIQEKAKGKPVKKKELWGQMRSYDLTKGCQVGNKLAQVVWRGLLLYGADTEGFYTEVQERILARYGKVFDWSLKAKMMGKKAAESARIFVDECGLAGLLTPAS